MLPWYDLEAIPGPIRTSEQAAECAFSRQATTAPGDRPGRRLPAAFLPQASFLVSAVLGANENAQKSRNADLLDSC